jgi:DNA (cytosine-5)-methyltransferase 1
VYLAGAARSASGEDILSAYYNEIDAYAAQWLRNLIAAGHIAAGDVDERSITEVRPDDLRGYTQCHFFAGIGGWSYALRLATWPDDRPVWTGSCPCQPFSAAGSQRGSDDERHLWPAFFLLIGECRPAAVFGEQVAGAAGLAWLDHVCADLEGAGYAAAAANIGAHSVGAPHIRQRLYWMADMQGGRRRQGGADASRCDERVGPQGAWLRPSDDRGGFLADADGRHASAERQQRSGQQRQQPQDSSARFALGDATEPRPQGRNESGERANAQRAAVERAGAVGVADAERRMGEWRANIAQRESEGRAIDRRLDPWAELEWIACSDGKARPTQPGLFPLAHGVSGRVGRLRAYGNAIVPQVAAEFIAAFTECR